ncbi:MAG: hypothetical protein CL693_03730 [Cellvibrionaceae bacterium]|nr:hypothetical protein [Cellvibrionaceae bacterium]|tara:strand:- start:11701 stop:12819 length:1119 start_codon:yes stop_codon:yes gene_type:complete
MGAQAAELKLNGFASVVAGKTLNQGTVFARDGLSETPINPAVTNASDATLMADFATGGVYDDDISFNPDSIFGLQISADLGRGLSATGQITGSGGEDFDATIAWAYLSYELNDSWTMVAGRQRLPLYFYSDYLDVGYAYHWTRAPIETQAPIDTLDGVQFRYQGSLGDWDTRLQVYGGSGKNDFSIISDEANAENIVGAVLYASNDWLQLRATYMVTDFYFKETGPAFGQGEDNAVGSAFTGIAAHASFGQGFVIAEVVTYGFDEVFQPTGWDDYIGGYISGGYRLGDFTPHITFSSENQEIKDSAFSMAGLTDGDDATDSVTVGVRWDFHPQAAFKLEYQVRMDESDDNIKAFYGDRNEVDLASLGFDVIF